MTYGSVSVDSVVTSSGQTLGAGDSSLMKNRIINGAMVIDQRNAGASVTPTSGSPYVVDRWGFDLSQSSKLTAQQNAGSVTTLAGFVNYLGVTSSSAYSIGSTDYFALRQTVEGFNIADLGWGTANAKTVTLSFQVYSSLTGTFGGSLRNSTNNYSYPFSYSIPITNTWTSISITISGPTGGIWYVDNRQGVIVYFGLGVGSTYSGTAGSWSANNYLSATGATSVVGTNGATFYITGVQLEVGSIATSFEYRMYQQELALCQRYYEKANYELASQDIISLSTPQTTSGIGVYSFKVTKRALPTNSYSALSDFTCYGSGYASLSLTALGMTASTNYCSLNPQVALGFLVQGGSVMRITGTSGWLSFSAEL